MKIFQSNAILGGYVNSYCLVCECSFESEEQIFSHIMDKAHKTKKLLYPFLEKYGNNCIRKVKAGYFCELCSLLMATAAKVNLHIAQEQHYHNKGNSLLKQFGSVVTAFDDILISETTWHSFADDACVLCDVEFDDGDEHKMERSHILKLLQTKVQFGADNNIYRKIGKNNVQCLTCNCVAIENTLDKHFNDDQHKQKYIECQEEKKKFDLANPKEGSLTENELQETVTVSAYKNVPVTENAVSNDVITNAEIELALKTTDPKKIDK